MALSPESRYAETDWSRSPQFAIRHSKWSGLLFHIHFGMDERGKSGGGPPQSKTWRKFVRGPANAKRLGVRQSSGALERGSQPGVAARRKRGRNLEGGFLPNAATPKRTGRALRNSQFAIRNGQGFFSGFHFGMDDWGIWRLNFPKYGCNKIRAKNIRYAVRHWFISLILAGERTIDFTGSRTLGNNQCPKMDSTN